LAQQTLTNIGQQTDTKIFCHCVDATNTDCAVFISEVLGVSVI